MIAAEVPPSGARMAARWATTTEAAEAGPSSGAKASMMDPLAREPARPRAEDTVELAETVRVHKGATGGGAGGGPASGRGRGQRGSHPSGVRVQEEGARDGATEGAAAAGDDAGWRGAVTRMSGIVPASRQSCGCPGVALARLITGFCCRHEYSHPR